MEFRSALFLEYEVYEVKPATEENHQQREYVYVKLERENELRLLLVGVSLSSGLPPHPFLCFPGYHE